MNPDPEQGFTISLPKRGKSMDLAALDLGLLHSGHEEDGISVVGNMPSSHVWLLSG